MECLICGGDKKVTVDCTKCDATGWVEKPHYNGFEVVYKKERCTALDPAGYPCKGGTITKPCPSCGYS